MKIGFIGFGEVGSTLAKKLLECDFAKDNIEIISSLENRSEKTRDLLEKISKVTKSKITLLKSFEDVAVESDILISSTIPSQALKIAKKYGKLGKGMFLDLNNISPDTTLKIKKSVENFSNSSISFVKGGIIGKITSKDSVIYLSGEKAKNLDFLKRCGFNIKIISEDVVDVSYIKMLRSIYTKGVTAIFYEIFDISEDLDLSNELFEALSITEGENFEFKSKSRIESVSDSYKRKFEELDEILKFLNNYYKIKDENNDKNNIDKDNVDKNNVDNYDINFEMIEAIKNKFKKIK